MEKWCVVSPKSADPAVRTALIEQAAKITAEEGRDALTLRRLAALVGTSTMAVYTHFGSMTELRRAVRREGFARLAAHLDVVDATDDPVADLVVLGWAYYVNAKTHPNLYRAMFMDGPVDDVDRDVGLDTFARLVDGVERCIRTQRFDPADPVVLATQLWVVQHGIVTLELAGLLTADRAFECCIAMGRNLVHAFGDDPDALDRSMTATRSRLAFLPTTGGNSIGA
jgi:AcrR family transcriptional regulator